MAKAEKVTKCGVKREGGFLYYLAGDGHVWKAGMTRAGKKPKVKPSIVVKTGVKRKKGFMYFIDKQGDVACVAMNRKGGKKKKKADLAKPTVKYLVYESKNASKVTVYKAKKVLLAANVRNVTVGKPTTKAGKFGVALKYESKSANFYKTSSKFVSLQKPATNLRMVNSVPKKYC
jgi:hypothetical protein